MKQTIKSKKGQIFTVKVDYPTETYGEYVSEMVDTILDDYSYIAVINADITVGKDFYELPDKYPEADIICTQAIPVSRIFSFWERLTFKIGLAPHIKGEAVIYKSEFLKKVGGYPKLHASSDTWLLSRSDSVVLSNVKVLHLEKFSVQNSFWRQVRDGEGRAILRYSAWKTVLHGIFRLRPFVAIVYCYYRLKHIDANSDTVFKRHWKRNARISLGNC